MYPHVLKMQDFINSRWLSSVSRPLKVTPSFAKKNPIGHFIKTGWLPAAGKHKQAGRQVGNGRLRGGGGGGGGGAGPIHLTLRNHAIVFALPNDGERERVKRPPSSLSLLWPPLPRQIDPSTKSSMKRQDVGVVVRLMSCLSTVLQQILPSRESETACTAAGKSAPSSSTRSR